MISAREAQLALERYYYEQNHNKNINKKHLKLAEHEVEGIIVKAVNNHKKNIIIDYSCKPLIGRYLPEIRDWLHDFGYRVKEMANSEILVDWSPDE